MNVAVVPLGSEGYIMDDLQRSLSLPSVSPDSASHSHLNPMAMDEELCMVAEERTQEILCTIQPNVVSEQNRKDIINYFQKLFRSYYGTKIFPFGSVPLKTYLPDGDIDLTVVSHQKLEGDMSRDLCRILESGENSEFEVRDVQYIPAQVKVVKCTVKGIAVDISFNQMSGLCTLCFLEQVDHMIGKNHLFKRSVILIKAWCYYESRILGAHHGLLSTYALETLVLYIINRFHSSLHGPLEVLYRFLEYYSSFDWDHYCLGINGPIPVSTLPDSFELPESEQGKLLLTKDFLRNCREMFTDPAMAFENRVQDFPLKHMNIVDPLKDNNNLGRSVNKGNFYRIRCALSYGVQKLRQILTLPGETMGRALEKFFCCTLDRNGKGLRPDVQVPVPAFGTGRSEASVLNGDYNSDYAALVYGRWYHNYTVPVVAFPSPPTSPSPLQDHSSCDIPEQATWYDWNFFYRKGTDIYVPRQILGHPNTSKETAATYSTEEQGKSRGTGTYIPDARNGSYGYMHKKLPRKKSSNSISCVQRGTPQKIQQTGEHSDSEVNGNGNSY